MYRRSVPCSKRCMANECRKSMHRGPFCNARLVQGLFQHFLEAARRIGATVLPGEEVFRGAIVLHVIA